MNKIMKNKKINKRLLSSDELFKSVKNGTRTVIMKTDPYLTNRKCRKRRRRILRCNSLLIMKILFPSFLSLLFKGVNGFQHLLIQQQQPRSSRIPPLSSMTMTIMSSLSHNHRNNEQAPWSSSKHRRQGMNYRMGTKMLQRNGKLTTLMRHKNNNNNNNNHHHYHHRMLSSSMLTTTTTTTSLNMVDIQTTNDIVTDWHHQHLLLHNTQLLISNTGSAVGEFIRDPFSNLPFDDLGQRLTNELTIDFGNSNSDIPEEETRQVLGSLGEDILIFLLSSVVVTTITNALGITPILGYLFVGALLGQYGLNVFSNAEAGVELGDFGILFLLFSEGLEVTSNRVQKLLTKLPLSLAQVSLTTGVITATLLLLGNERIVPFINHEGFLNIHDPIQAVIIAMAGTLSTSAFIFPVLKEKGWEEDMSGEAATTILLLQDLLVAPLLVLLPYLASSGGTETDYTAIGFLTAKATIGFGLVLTSCSYILSSIFNLVAQTRSSETFVALCLLVACGMGEIAKLLGLTDTAGAFAAGVLLANTNYRAQIQADILPFKGILLGIFFMDAGSNFDINIVMDNWQVVLGGSVLLIIIKFITLRLATLVPDQFEPNKLPVVDATRVSVLLSGGGEFAFVVLAAAESLSIIDTYCLKLLTAIVLVTMGITPILGDIATALTTATTDTTTNKEDMNTDPMMAVTKATASTTNGDQQENHKTNKSTNNNDNVAVAEDSIVICGHSEPGRALLRVLEDNYDEIFQNKTTTRTNSIQEQNELINIVAFTRDPSRIGVPPLSSTYSSRPLQQSNSNIDINSTGVVPKSLVVYGNGQNPEVIKNFGIIHPRAIFVTYGDHNEVISAVARLRSAFPYSAGTRSGSSTGTSNTPIYARAANRRELQNILAAGATDAVVECDELARVAIPLLQIMNKENISSLLHTIGGDDDADPKKYIDEAIVNINNDNRIAAATATELPIEVIDELFLLYSSLDTNADGLLDLYELIELFRKTKDQFVASDDEIYDMEDWLLQTRLNNSSCNSSSPITVIDKVGFCLLYKQAPDFVKKSFGNMRGKTASAPTTKKSS